MLQFFQAVSSAKKSYPLTSPDSQTIRYQNYKLGWWFHAPFDVDFPEGNELRRAPTDVDWSAMATAAASAGNVDFACMHIQDLSGFLFFDADTKYNNGTPVGGVPVYSNDYNIGNLPYVDDYIGRFIDSFNAVGIDASLYFGTGRDDNNYPVGNKDDDLYWQYLANLATEVMDKYGARVFNIYFDELAGVINDANVTAEHKRVLYDAIKNRFGRIQITGNFNQPDTFYDGNGDLKYFPVDVVGQELSFFPIVNENELSDRITQYDGTDYYMPRQYGYSGLYRFETSTPANEFTQYPWLQANYLVDYTKNQVRTQQEFQDACDESKSHNMTFWANVPIKHDGSLDATYMSRLENLVL